MATPTEVVAAFVDKVEHLAIDDWKRVDEARPMGYASVSRLVESREWLSPFPWLTERLEKLIDQMVEDRQAARPRFGSYSAHRLFTALNVLRGREHLGQDSFVAGFGPFLPVIPPSSIGINDEVAELWDPRVRAPIVERYAEVLRSLQGRETASEVHLTDDPARISLALCLESIGASEARRSELEEMYVLLCAFPSVAASAAANGPDPVRECQATRLKWLGHTGAKLPERERATIGSGIVRRVVKEGQTTQNLMAVGCLLIPSSVVVATLVATAARPNAVILIGAWFVGVSGLVVGLPIYLKLSRRARFGSAERPIILAVSVLVMIAVAAACGFLYIRFITG